MLKLLAFLFLYLRMLLFLFTEELQQLEWNVHYLP